MFRNFLTNATSFVKIHRLLVENSKYSKCIQYGSQHFFKFGFRLQNHRNERHYREIQVIFHKKKKFTSQADKNGLLPNNLIYNLNHLAKIKNINTSVKKKDIKRSCFWSSLLCNSFWDHLPKTAQQIWYHTTNQILLSRKISWNNLITSQDNGTKKKDINNKRENYLNFN